MPIPLLHVAVSGQPRVIVWEAVLSAIQRVERPACGSLLDDYRDAAGRPLAANLALSGRTAVQYLSDLRFTDGGGTRQCSLARTVAATQPGSHVIFICGVQFEKEYRADPEAASMIVLHEFLHSLGLGENPPSSLEITATVTARCGD